MIILENQEEPSSKYKTVLRRFYAIVIDIIIYLIILMFWFIPEDAVYQFNKNGYSESHFEIYAIYVGLVNIVFFLYMILTQYYFSQTFGDKVVGIKVMNQREEHIKVRQLVIRNTVIILYFSLLYLTEFKLLIRGYKSSEIEVEHNLYVSIIYLLLIIFLIINSFFMLNSKQRKGLFDIFSETNMVRTTKKEEH